MTPPRKPDGHVLGLLPTLGGGLADLARAGQDVRFVTSYLEAYAKAFRRIHLFSHFHEDFPWHLASPLLRERLRFHPRPRGIPRRAYALVLAAVQRRVLRECDVLRVFQVTGVLPAVVAKRRWGLPFAVTYGFRYTEFARVDGKRAKARLLTRLENLALQRADAVIVTLREIESELTARSPAAPLHRIPNGVDTALFTPAPRLAARGGPAEILFVGRFEHQKNLGRLLDALARVQRSHPLRLTLVGAGSLQGRLEEQAQNLGVPATFHPPVPHPELARLMASCDLFVLPSLIEGHAKVLTEAMSCGAPVVASSCDGNRELVKDRMTGRLVDPLDTEDMATAIADLLGDPASARRMGRAARASVVRQFNLPRLVGREVRLLQSLARGRTR